MPTKRIVLLIDADNISASHVDDVISSLIAKGDVIVRRVYGDWVGGHLSAWVESLTKHGMLPVQVAPGKNATDLAITIDAMDLLHTGLYQAFALVSNDADFTRLAFRLREAGRKVIVVGTKQVAGSLAAAASTVVHLPTEPEPSAASQKAPQPQVPAQKQPQPCQPSKLKSVLTEAIARSGQGEWTQVSWLGSEVRKVQPTFDYKTYGAASFSKLLRSQPYLEVAMAGTQMKVRVRKTIAA